MSTIRLLRRCVPMAGGATLLMLGVAPLPAGATGAATWYVSAATGTDSGGCGTSASAPCATIGQAVSNAAAGDTIKVAAGTYAEQVTVAKSLVLEGPGMGTGSDAENATVSPPASAPNGFTITAGGAGSTVEGFEVTGAQGEGILAVKTSNVTIRDNLVHGNDLGASNPSTTYQECQGQGDTPGDCGEGIHLMSTTASAVLDNVVYRNAGGVLLTDEMGPTARNLVAYNSVYDNAADCGITLAGHSPNAAPQGAPAPSAAGIYDNRIVSNMSSNNGLEGFGAGVVLAGAGPGTAVYDNLIDGNILYHNGMGGVTLHDHAPGQYLMGNVIRNNVFDSNDTAGAPGPSAGDEDTFGAPGGGLHQSADLILFSAADTETGTVVSNNTFENAHYGIWTFNVPAIASNNHYASSIAVHASQTPRPTRTTISGPAKAKVGHHITLRGAAQAGQRVTVLGKVPGGHYRAVGHTTASAKGHWRLSVRLRHAHERFRASAYGSTSRTITVK